MTALERFLSNRGCMLAARAERRAAPKPVRIPSGDRPTYPSGEGCT
jgi:hypothetical protein